MLTPDIKNNETKSLSPYYEMFRRKILSALKKHKTFLRNSISSKGFIHILHNYAEYLNATKAPLPNIIHSSLPYILYLPVWALCRGSWEQSLLSMATPFKYGSHIFFRWKHYISFAFLLYYQIFKSCRNPGQNNMETLMVYQRELHKLQ